MTTSLSRTMVILLTALAVGPSIARDFVFSGLEALDLTPLAAQSVAVGSGTELILVDRAGVVLPIVFADDERAQAAAGYLSSVLTEMSGVECDSYRLPEGATNTFSRCISIPRPEAGEAFAVIADAGGVRFSGRSDYAVYDFCERVLGVRQYWNGPVGRSVCKGGRIVIPFLRYSDAPVFAFRRYSADGRSEFFRVAKCGGDYDAWTRCHTTGAGFCYGSPEGFDEFCQRVEADIAGGERFQRVVDRERRTVSVSPCDVAYDCHCPWCSTLRSNLALPPGQATPILWERFLPRFSKYLAERHPDYRVCVLPYWNYVMAPKTELGTNVWAEVCSMSGLAAFKWDRVREREEGIIRSWAAATGRPVANWHYSCWPAVYTPAAYVYGRTIADHYRRMRDCTVGSFICGSERDFPRFSLSLYVWMRCLWNPDVNPDAIYDEFCVRQFGPAAKLMREVIEIQEVEWNPETLVFSRDSMERLAKRLNESRELVRDTAYQRAFEYYAAGFAEMFKAE